MMEKAFSLEMFAPPNWHYQVGLSHLMLGQWEKAASSLLVTTERAPWFTPAYLLLAWAYFELDRLEDARDAVKTALEFTPQYTVKWVVKVYPYRSDEVRERLVNSLRKAGLPDA